MMCSGTIWKPFGVLFIFILEPLLAGISKPVMVNLRETAILSCNSTCNGKLLWTFKASGKNLEVLKCVQGDCTEGDGFKRRVEIKHGHASLTILPALYNDEGWYEAQCDSKILCTVHLDVLVPTTVNASFQDNVTLPCYARTEKDIADDAVNILWKKEDQTPKIVLEVKNGHTSYGSGFKKRASVSLNHYRDGDLTLSLSTVTPSDNGFYRCYHRQTDEHGYPTAVTLTVTAHQSIQEKNVGDDLTLELFILDEVTITFSGSEGAEMHVCSVVRSIAQCDLKYDDRVSVENASLVLSGLSSFDSGTFTVKDNMGNIISVCTVTVKVARRHYWTIVFSLSLFVCVGLFRLYLYIKAQKQHVYLNNYRYSVETPSREPASIGLSEEETRRDNCDQSDVPHTPVQETSPEIPVTIPKQDTLEELDKLHEND